MHKIILLIALFLGVVRPAQAQLVFNEIYSSPATGQSEWLELYNPTDIPVNLADWQLAELVSGQIKNHELISPSQEATIAAYGYFVFTPAKVTLNNGGDTLYLFAPGDTQTDVITYPKLTSDQVYARLPDGADNWDIMTNFTPGVSNPVPTPTEWGSEPDASASTTTIVSATTDTNISQTSSKTIASAATTTNSSANSSLASTADSASVTVTDQDLSWREGIEFRLPQLSYRRREQQQAIKSSTPQVLGAATSSAQAVDYLVTPNFGLIFGAGLVIITALVLLVGLQALDYYYSDDDDKQDLDTF